MTSFYFRGPQFYMDQPTTIGIADAQLLIRAGLRSLLQEMNNISILFEADDESELLTFLAENQPDILVVDYNHPARFSVDSIIEVVKEYPNLGVVVISDDNDKGRIYTVLENGVGCYITKTCDEQEVKDALRAAARREKFFCGKVLDYLLEKSFAKPTESCAPTPLSAREIEIVQLIAKGLIAKEIANLLHLSPHTVYTHRKNIMKKLELSSASELMVYAINHGLVSVENDA